MSNFILALRTALAIIPEIINIIKALEVPGFGAEKLQAVIAIVLEAVGAMPEELKALLDASKFGSFVSKIVSIVVTFLNAVGVFKKST